MDTDAQLAQYFAGMWPHLDEYARRLVAASQAVELGYGGISRVSRGSRRCQNPSNSSCRHSSHPSQQLPNARGLRNSISFHFTCTAATASAGISRSSGNRLNVRKRCSRSSNTSNVLRQAACCVSLISPRYSTRR
jgi:hypothetical protein